MEGPLNLTAAVIAAHVPQPDGGYVTFTGTGTAAGTFSIPSVPMQPYLLQVGSSLVFVANGAVRTVELGAQVPGRFPVDTSTSGTKLSLSMTNLAPWTVDDDLQVASWNAPVDYFSTYYFFSPFAANAPAVGATTLNNAELDWSAGSHFRVRQSVGDDLTLIQLSGRTDAGYLIQEAKRGLAVASAVDMTAGSTTPLTGAFATLPQISATFDLRHGDFAALVTAVHPNAINRGGGGNLSVSFGPSTVRRYASGFPDLVSMTLPAGSGNVVASWSYGNPFPPTWTKLLVATTNYSLAYAIDLPDGGTTAPNAQFVAVGATQVTTGAGALGPVGVTQTPVRFVQIDGVAANAGPITISTTPNVSWTLPAIGVPTSIGIRITRLTEGTNSATRRTALFSLTVPGNITQLRLPPGLLLGGSRYFLTVTANADAVPFDAAKPFQDTGYPSAYAQALTSVLRTP